MWSHTLNNLWFLVCGFCKEHGSIITYLINCPIKGKYSLFIKTPTKTYELINKSHCLKSSGWTAHQRVTGHISKPPEGTISDRIIFIHKNLNIPTKSTLLSAIDNGQLVTFPMMKKTNLAKYLPKLEEFFPGHLNQKRIIRSQ